jgi:hypothetical protein
LPTIFFFDAMAAAFAPQMLAQQLPVLWIEQPYNLAIPLHLHLAADPAGRRAVVSGLHFDAAIQMNGSLAG